MLVLSRKHDEKIRIGDNIEVVVLKIRGNQVQLGVIAPKNVRVHRQEVYEQINGSHDDGQQRF